MRRPTGHRLPLPPLRTGWWVAVWLLLGTPSPALRAQGPTFYEPKEDYYRARGTGMKVTWSVDRDTVPEDGAIVATLTIRGASNPHEIVRPDLGKMSKFSAAFQVENVGGEPARPDAKEVAFAYRLRPRNRDVKSLPGLDFKYLNPGITVGDPFQTARARSVPITVTAAAPKPKPPAIPLAAPDHLFAVTTGPPVLGREPFAPGVGAWLVLAAVPPLAGGLWFVAWRRVYPDAARLARARRNRAGRRALTAIRKAGCTPDPAAAVAGAVTEYLRARFPLPPGADTPPEVGGGLRAAGLADTLTGDVVTLLRACDAARFAPASDTSVSLAADAEAVVARVGAVE